MEFKTNAKIETSEFWYDLFDGGYIKPETLLENKEDIERVQAAIKTIQEFYNSAEEQEVLEEF